LGLPRRVGSADSDAFRAGSFWLLFTAKSLAQTAGPKKSPELTSLCELQKKGAEGKHETVRVSGVHIGGPEGRVLEDTACPNEVTWIELELRSNQNKKKLYKLLDHSRGAHVVYECDFYGPPLPDPKLPETIKKNYHPGWGHLGAFRTKLVVHAVRDVKPAPRPTEH